MSFKKGDTVYIKIGAAKIMKGKTSNRDLEKFEGNCYVVLRLFSDGSVIIQYDSKSQGRWFLPECCEHSPREIMLEIEESL